jgi:vanillate O-demethylase ferredoxin subunit
MNWILNAARNAGWRESQLHVEYFSNTVPHPSSDPQSFEVQIGLNGPLFTVESDQSITNVLRANGVYIPTSCEQGICGTCLTNVLEGIPEHRDQFLTESERVANTMIMPCCSRAKSSRLVLDL